MHSRPELTLSGGGSIFLKSNKAKTPDTPETPLVSPGLPPPIIEVVTNSDPNDPVPKSILRGVEPHPKSPQNRSLYDLDPRDMSSEEKQLWRKQELEEEQRKSVRFNLDKELDIRFQISDSEENGEEEEEEDEEIEEEEEEIAKEEWNSEDEEEVAERLIAGIKVSGIMNLMDASELDEPSTKDVSHLPVLPEDNFETQMQREMLCNDVGDLADKALLSSSPQTWWEGCVVAHQTCTWQLSEETSSTTEISESNISTSYDLKFEEKEDTSDAKVVPDVSSEKSPEEKSSSNEVANKLIPELVVTEAEDEDAEEENEEEDENDEEVEIENASEPEVKVKEIESKTIKVAPPSNDIPNKREENEEEVSKQKEIEEVEEVDSTKPSEIEKTSAVPCMQKPEEEDEENAESDIAQGLRLCQKLGGQAVAEASTVEPDEEIIEEEVIEMEDGASEGELDQLEEGQEGDSGQLGISPNSISNLEGLRLSGVAVTEDKEEVEDSEDLRHSSSAVAALRQPRLDALRQKGASSPDDESSIGGGLKRDDSEQFTLSPTPVLKPLRIESLRLKGASSPDEDSSTGGGGRARRGVRRSGGEEGDGGSEYEEEDEEDEEEEEDEGGGGGGGGRGEGGLRGAAGGLVGRRPERMLRAVQADSQRMLRAFQEQLQMNSDAAVHRLEDEHAHQLAQLQEQLLGEEDEERRRLQEEIAGRLGRLHEQMQAQEKSLREELSESLAALKASLSSENESQLEQHRTKLEAQLKGERQRLEEESARMVEGLRTEVEESNRRMIEEVRASLEAEGRAQAENLRQEMEAKREEVAERHRKDLEEVDARAQSLLADRLETRLQELETTALAQASQDLETRRAQLAEEQKASLEQMRQDHKEEEELLRREHLERLEETRVRFEIEKQRARERDRENEEKEREKLVESARILEKLRCEKRLLEDKYRSLKEKYIRLKTDVKLSIERRKRREGGGTTTGSETERSTSHTRTSANSASAALAAAAARPVDSERYCPASVNHPVSDLVYFCHYTAPLL